MVSGAHERGIIANLSLVGRDGPPPSRTVVLAQSGRETIILKFMDSLAQTVAHARADFLQAKGALEASFGLIPNDKLTWTASPSARSAAAIFAHCAWATSNILSQLKGTPFHIPTSSEADASFLEQEKSIATRQQALDLMEHHAAIYLEWLDALTPADFERQFPAPFGLGFAPMEMAITFPAAHMRYHVGQLDYIQTLLGDRSWHLPTEI